ncbi:MAG: LLM class flavin-dependent oxidoreductase [Candidatus Puniceispirillaceae bacterium]
MKFHLSINLERMDENVSMTEVRDHTLEMVQMADKAGFELVWAAEHHALEMTIAPNPFQLMTWWATHTQNIRLGAGVVNAAYWHPINLAGEAAMTDLISGGRVDLGIGSGAYQREFDRMHPGLDQKEGYKYLQEMLPLVKKLWQGDVTHNGEFWQFPAATSCPKPMQDEVPLWVAARAPVTFDYAVQHNCNIMSWPLTMPFSEAEAYRQRLDEAIVKSDTDFTGKWALMRHTAVYKTNEDKQAAIDAVRSVLAMFGNLMMQSGEVVNGFPSKVPLESLEGNVRVDPEMLAQNLAFGTPEEVVAKLKQYEALGVDAFIYYASMGLDRDQQKRSLQYFIEEVMPEFT